MKLSEYKKTKLIRVSPKTFIQGNNLGYNIYKKDDSNIYRKYIQSNQKYSIKEIESLENENIEHLYIKHDDFEKYSKDINKYLSNIVSDIEISSLMKSKIMHDLACDTMHEKLSGNGKG